MHRWQMRRDQVSARVRHLSGWDRLHSTRPRINEANKDNGIAIWEGGPNYEY